MHVCMHVCMCVYMCAFVPINTSGTGSRSIARTGTPGDITTGVAPRLLGTLPL